MHSCWNLWQFWHLPVGLSSKPEQRIWGDCQPLILETKDLRHNLLSQVATGESAYLASSAIPACDCGPLPRRGLAECHMWRSAPIVLSLISTLVIGTLWRPLMIRILSVPRILRVAVCRSILWIVRRYRGQRDIGRHWRALVVRSRAVVFFPGWRGVLSWRWRVLRFSKIARVSRWRIGSSLLFRIRHIVIDRHGDGLIGEFLASKVRELKSLDGVYTSGRLVVLGEVRDGRLWFISYR